MEHINDQLRLSAENKKVLAVQSCSQATEKTEGGKGWMNGWMKGGEEVKKLAISFCVLVPSFFFDFTLAQPFCLPSSSYSSLLPLQHPKQKSVVTFPPPSSSSPAFPPPYSCHFLCLSFIFITTANLPPAPPSLFPPPTCSSSSSSTWGTLGNRRRWSISILPLGFLFPV